MGGPVQAADSFMVSIVKRLLWAIRFGARSVKERENIPLTAKNFRDVFL